MRNELGDDESVSDYYTNFVQDFAKEIELMSNLTGHSNIVSLEDHDFIQHKDGFGWDILIRMELLTPFIDYQSNHTLSTDEVLQLGIDICTALETCEKKVLFTEILSLIISLFQMTVSLSLEILA